MHAVAAAVAADAAVAEHANDSAAEATDAAVAEHANASAAEAIAVAGALARF